MSIERFVERQPDAYGFGGHIIKAAVRVGTIIYTGWRHADIIWHLGQEGICAPGNPITGEMQGFIDNRNIFHNRYMAGKIAANARQLNSRKMGYELISEDLWDNVGKFHVPKTEWRIADHDD